MSTLDEMAAESDNMISYVSNALTKAWEHNLEAEVVYSALNYMRTTPKATIEEALEHGLNDWIK